MKTKVTQCSLQELKERPRPEHRKPQTQKVFWRWLLKTLGGLEMKATGFTYEEIGMEKLAEDEPCLILMNHSSFTDLSMAATLLSNRPYHIVCTYDGFIGKKGLMRRIGCMPTRKFIADLTLLRDMKYVFHELKESVLMFPEAGYSFDGTATVLPDSLGKCLKMMKVPVVMVKAEGAFLRDPLYNNLQKRQVKTSATVTYLLNPEEIAKKSVEELNEILREQFSFDYWRTQHAKGIRISEAFRADGLHRVLYQCPQCMQEGQMEGKGSGLTCHQCGASYELQEDGTLANAPFTYVSDWYAWERQQVRKEIEAGIYKFEQDVDIYVLSDTKCLYQVGEGHLVHNAEGFHLTGCEGALSYRQSVKASYTLNADYFWYEIGDMITIGDGTFQYVCFPKDQKNTIVSKARLATEEMFKIAWNR